MIPKDRKGAAHGFARLFFVSRSPSPPLAVSRAASRIYCSMQSPSGEARLLFLPWSSFLMTTAAIFQKWSQDLEEYECVGFRLGFRFFAVSSEKNCMADSSLIFSFSVCKRGRVEK
jgi:hypothetical protein